MRFLLAGVHHIKIKRRVIGAEKVFLVVFNIQDMQTHCIVSEASISFFEFIFRRESRVETTRRSHRRPPSLGSFTDRPHLFLILAEPLKRLSLVGRFDDEEVC